MTDDNVSAADNGRRDLGSVSAETDVHFLRNFVESREFSRLLQDECSIVIGAKGSGKTAVMRALADVYPSRYAHVKDVKLDGLKFDPLFGALQELDRASGQGLVAIARAAWQNIIAINVLEGMLETKLADAGLRREIRRYLVKSDQLGTSSTDKFSTYVERLWQKVVIWSGEKKVGQAPPLMGLTPRQQSAISSFPADSRLEDLLRRVFEAVDSTGKKFLLCFDGLDSVVEHTIESRDYLFAGLIDAVYKSATHPLLSRSLSLKMLIPKELAHGARRRLRDLDKEEQYFEAIHWNDQNLADFLRKRMDRYVKVKGRPFDEVWREYFPEKVRNDAHGIDEETFHYLLRHTLFRPRQLLLQVQSILNKWDSRPNVVAFRIDPTFIPRVVSETNYRLSEYVVNELVLDFPNLESFLKSFRGIPCVTQWSVVCERLKSYLGVPKEKVNESFTELYNYGIFGVMASSNEAGKASTFRFGFMSQNVERHIAATLIDDSQIALAPMFAEYCGCRSSPVGVVSPID